MSNDIVKQIIVKIKGDTADASKSIKGLVDSLKNAQRPAENIGKQFEKIGKQGAADFTKIKNTLNEISKINLRNLQNEINTTAQRAEARLRYLKNLESKPGVSEKIRQKAENLATQSGSNLEALMKRWAQSTGGGGGVPGAPPTAAGGAGGGGRGGIGIGQLLGQVGGPLGQLFGGILNNPAARVGMMALVPEIVGNYAAGNMSERMQNMATVGGIAVRRAQEYYNTDPSNFLLSRVDPTYNQRREKYVSDQLANRSMGLARQNIMGHTADMLTQGQFWQGLYGATVPFLGGGGAKGVQNIQEAWDRTKENTADMQERLSVAAAKAREEFDRAQAASSKEVQIYLPKFMERAASRYQIQRQMGITSKEHYGIRSAAQDMTPDEVDAMLQTMAPILGGAGAAQLGGKAGMFRTRYGMGLEQSGAMLTTLAMSGAGGSKEAADNLEKMIKEGILAGFEDTGLRDTILKNTKALIDSSNTRIGATAAMQTMLQYAPENADARQTAAVAGAAQLGQEILHGDKNTYMRTMRRANFRSLLGKKASPEVLDYLQNMSEAEMQSAAGGELGATARGLGLTPTFFQKALSQEARMATGANATTRSLMAKAEQEQKTLGYVTEETKARLSLALPYYGTGTTKQTEEQRYQATTAILAKTGVYTGVTALQSRILKEGKDKEILQAFDEKQRSIWGGPEGILFDQKIKAGKDLDKQIYGVINPVTGKSVSEEIGEAVQVQGLKGEGTGELPKGDKTDPKFVVQNAIDQLNYFAAGVATINQKLGFSGSSSGYRANTEH
jgi:hypothetical protein